MADLAQTIPLSAQPSKPIYILKPLTALLTTLLLAACEAPSSTPYYGGLSIGGFNYTPYNLSDFIITDERGNTVGGGGSMMPGAGEGSLSCCYALEGTHFTVKWRVYDNDEANRAYRKDRSAPIRYMHKITLVYLPPTKASGGPGTKVLGLHFYPDDHIEFEFRNDFRGTRIFYSEINYRLKRKYRNLMDPQGELHVAAMFRRTARIAAEGWAKYRYTDTDDLEEYVHFVLLVHPRFDEHPAVQAIIRDTAGRPGAFGAAMQQLPEDLIKQIKNQSLNAIKKESHHG